MGPTARYSHDRIAFQTSQAPKPGAAVLAHDADHVAQQHALAVARVACEHAHLQQHAAASSDASAHWSGVQVGSARAWPLPSHAMAMSVSSLSASTLRPTRRGACASAPRVHP